MSIAEERRAGILRELEVEGSVSVTALCERFHVSEMTVRRDLVELQEQGIVRRFRGGAELLRGRSNEPPFMLRASKSVESKLRIAAHVAGLIGEGESVALSYGTTVLSVARELATRNNLAVVTPDLRVAVELSSSSGVRIVLAGGLVRPGELTMRGREAERAFQDHLCDTAIIGAAGVHHEFGVTDFHSEEVDVIRAIVAGAQRVIVVADGSKVGSVAFARVVPVTDADLLVTSSDAPSGALRDVAALGLEVAVV